MTGAATPQSRFVADPRQIAERIRLEPAGRRLRALVAGHTVAESDAALIMLEADYPPRVYFPRADVRMDLLRPTDHHTYCPFKGEASYWTLEAGGRTIENAAWAYLVPFLGMEAIGDGLSFVDAVEIEG
jgi:uncharacterized protein (DUF427 family)